MTPANGTADDVPEQYRTEVVRQRRSVVIGRPSLGLLVFAWGSIFAALGFCWTALAQPPNAPSNILQVAPICGAVLVFMYLAGTTRVVVRPEGVELVSLVLTYVVPLDQVAGSSTDGGFELVLVSGRRVGTTAYGDSVLGQLLKHRRGHQVARRLNKLTGVGPVDALTSWQQDSVRGKPRYSTFAVAVLLAALLIAGTLLINQLY